MSAGSPISIVIRSMDRPSLGRALDSIAAQTTKPMEVIVVAACGAKHRPLGPAYESINARLVFPPEGTERLDRPRAANRGLAVAKGEWIGFLDDDDEYLPNHLETLWSAAAAAHQRRGLDGRLAYSLAQGVDAAGRETDRYGRSFSLVQIWNNTILHTMNGLFHRSLLTDGCRFDESLDILEDWDFWIQCAQHTEFAFVEIVTSKWHGDLGDSGCGFGGNLDTARYAEAQTRIQAKWKFARDIALKALHDARVNAHAARARGDEDEAIRLSRWVLRRDPENADMANLLGMLVLKRGDVTSAGQLISAAIQFSPPHFGLFLNMGLVEQARGNKDAAREWFLKGLALNPGHPGLIQRLSEVS